MNRKEITHSLLTNDTALKALYSDLATLEGSIPAMRFAAYAGCQSTLIKDKEFAAIGATADLNRELIDTKYQIEGMESSQRTLRSILAHGYLDDEEDE